MATNFGAGNRVRLSRHYYEVYGGTYTDSPHPDERLGTVFETAGYPGGVQVLWDGDGTGTGSRYHRDFLERVSNESQRPGDV
jgi:hypothetical protein